jgi:hypothetical protein
MRTKPEAIEPRPQRHGGVSVSSAGEHWLRRRAEFKLNVALPIPFDGWGNMEVDLLCAEVEYRRSRSTAASILS